MCKLTTTQDGRLTVDLGEIDVDGMFGLIINTFHYDEIKELNEKLNSLLAKNPGLIHDVQETD